MVILCDVIIIWLPLLPARQTHFIFIISWLSDMREKERVDWVVNNDRWRRRRQRRHWRRPTTAIGTIARSEPVRTILCSKQSRDDADDDDDDSASNDMGCPSLALINIEAVVSDCLDGWDIHAWWRRRPRRMVHCRSVATIFVIHYNSSLYYFRSLLIFVHLQHRVPLTPTSY